MAHGPEHGKDTDLWSTLLGGLDVEVRHLGEALHPHIPAWMKTPAVERLVGLIKGYVQGLHMHGFQGAFVERLTDIMDVAFTGGEKSGSEKKTKAWMDDFMADARKRLADAPDKGAMIAQLKAELKLYREFYEEIVAAKEKHDGPAEEPPFDWGSVDSSLSNALQSVNDALHETKLARRGEVDWIEDRIAALKAKRSKS